MKKALFFCLSLLTAIYASAQVQNDNCSGATSLTVGSYFTSEAIISTNTGATTDGSVPSCNANGGENVWFSVVVPASGKVTIQTRKVSGSLFEDSVLTVYSGACGSLTEIACNDDFGAPFEFFSMVSLTGQTPGATLYVSVSKYDSNTDNGEFLISAYNSSLPLSNDDCSGATPLSVGSDFTSGAVISTNVGATTDGHQICSVALSSENVWFKVIVPASGKVTIETRQVANSQFYNSVLSVYSGACGSLTQITCDDDSGVDSFSLISLTGQTPGATLYVSVWNFATFFRLGEFQISAYDDSILHTSEVDKNKETIHLSPNPFSDLLTISDISEVESISVTDSSGRLIKTFEKVSTSIYLGDLKEGLYFVTLKMNNGSTKTLKTIKK